MASRIKQGGVRLRLTLLRCASELVISASSPSAASSAALWEHPPSLATGAAAGLLGVVGTEPLA